MPLHRSIRPATAVRSLILLLCLMTGAAYAAETGTLAADLKSRRAAVRDRLGPDSISILFSAPVQTYSRNITYKFRQDSNLYYLTGIEQEETILVLMPGNATRREILFVQPRNPWREHWEGRLLSREEAAAASGVETVYLTTEFELFVDAVVAGRPYDDPPYTASSEFEPFFAALRDGRARVFLDLDRGPGLDGELSRPYRFAALLRERFVGFEVHDVSPVIHELRQIKTPYEQDMLRRSVEISSAAHLAGMRTARPGAYEYEVEAAIEHGFRSNGALGPGYPSIVGSGPNATILHYRESSRQMQDGELLLVDAAANYQYLTGDITRTYPVNGRFTPEQRAIYEIVLDAQNAAIAEVRPGVTLIDLHWKTVEVIKAGLLRLGLITDTSGDQFRTWYTHGATHFIGIDVHDVGPRDRPLQPGMAFVIEPGIYIREGALDQLADTRENAAFAQQVRPTYEKYKGIGIRIEDSFLLTEEGLERLSSALPRTIEEIESLLLETSSGEPAEAVAR